MDGHSDQHLHASPDPSPSVILEEASTLGQPLDHEQATTYLKLRGLPFSAQQDDIVAFFRQGGIELQQVFLCKRNGRSNGEAYVQLADPAMFSVALETLNRKNLGHRYIELFPATEADMATARTLTVDRLRGYVVRMRGLPYTASASDVLRFLDGIEVVRGLEGVIFTWTPDGRPTGEAFVELKDEAAQCEAMKRHKELMGTRYIEMFTSTKAALIQAIQHNRLILGFSNRKKWLQQAGVQPQMYVAQPSGLYPVVATQQGVPAGYTEVTDSFAGMSLSHQPRMGVLRPGGSTVGLPQGTTLLAAAPGAAGPSRQGPLLQRQDVQAYPGTATLQPAGGGTTLRMEPGLQMRSLRPTAAGPQVVQQATYMPAGVQQIPGTSMVVQQPYTIIQQPTPQFVTMEPGYSSMQPVGGTAQDSYGGRLLQTSSHIRPGGGQGQQYLVGPSQGYALQTIQLPAGEQNVQHYLQLSGGSGGAGGDPGGYSTAGGLPLGMDALAGAGDVTQQVLHQP